MIYEAKISQKSLHISKLWTINLQGNQRRPSRRPTIIGDGMTHNAIWGIDSGFLSWPQVAIRKDAVFRDVIFQPTHTFALNVPVGNKYIVYSVQLSWFLLLS